tara:strand:- start:17748 stop:19778 length:2031 start_codon:yes stop_codon:yes gene_type:complete
MNKVIAIVQARSESSRLPRKVVRKINNNEIIKIIFKRLSKSKKINKIILATTKDKSDDDISILIKKLGFEVYRGSKNNVLSRYYKIAKKYSPNYIVRITGDCPLVDPKIVDKVLEQAQRLKVDYCSNVIEQSFPDGLDVEVFTLNALAKAFKEGKTKFDKEHVTSFMRRNKKIKKLNIKSEVNNSKYRLCLDEEKDYELINIIFNKFKPNIHFDYNKIINFLKKNKDLIKINSHLKLNEGSFLNTGQKLWRFAKSIIPGGTMLLSKDPDRFLPDLWPAYFSRARGCQIWDLDGKKYFDLSSMGVGTNVLGYANKKIDKKVKINIEKGNLSTLLCPEEVELSKKLIEIHPWFQMVKLARTGGEANAIAVRIARNFTGDDKIAICGYHGWHDWYISANLNKNSLDQHLLKGLNASGVPKKLKNTVYPFEYNDYKKLELIVKKNKIKIIKMEVIRNQEPKNNFLKKVRRLADKHKIILIFDECTTGFRETFGGIHIKYKVIPDMAIFGKTLGNGYAITAVLGKREIMQKSEDTFISSTFWTERIGPTAAIATLHEMKKEKSWEIISKKGKKFKKIWAQLSKKYKLPIKIYGLDSLCKFDFKLKINEKYKLLITSEMLKKGFLATNSIYVSTSHSDNIINKYKKALDNIFKIINECEKGNINIENILKVKDPLKDFQRLN